MKMRIKLAIVIFVAFFCSFGKENSLFIAKSHAQMNTIYKIDPNKKPNKEAAEVKYLKISGKVTSAEHKKKGLIASVYVKALRINTVTDEKGNFSFKVPENFEGDLSLVFSANGTHSLTKTLSKQDFNAFQKVFLVKKEEIMEKKEIRIKE
jgi:hypothetical protein